MSRERKPKDEPPDDMDADAVPGHALAPFVPPDPLMAMFWFPALKYALGDDSMMRAFEEETGCEWSPPRSALDSMIDEATGNSDEVFLARFAEWFNANVWGDPNLRAGDGGDIPGDEDEETKQ